MKFPKLRGELTAGGIVGMKQASALEGVDSPFLTASGPGFITRKKNGFTEVIPTGVPLEQGKPYLWALGTPEFANAGVYLADPLRKKFKHYTNAGLLASWSCGVFLGGRAGVIEASATTGSPETFKYRLTTATFKSAAPDERGPEVELTPRSLFVSGKDEVGNVQWGMAARPVSYAGTETAFSDAVGSRPVDWVGFGANYPCAPKIVRHTGDVVALPAEPEPYRVYFGGSVHEAGRGKLLSLVVPRDSVYQATVGLGNPSTLKQTAPYIAASSDHGESWSRIEVPALAALIRKTTISAEPWPTTYDIQDSEVLRAIGTTARFVYLGDNISLLLVNGLKTSGGATFNAMFRFNWLTSVLDRVDAGETSTRGVWRSTPPGTTGFTQLETPSFLYPTSMCFGRGCAAFPMTSGFDYLLRITRDFGDSWETVTLPVEVGQGAFIVLSPYVNPDKPGRLLIHNDTSIYLTTGLFNSFKLLGPTSRPAHATGTPVWFYKRGALHPENPGEY